MSIQQNDDADRIAAALADIAKERATDATARMALYLLTISEPELHYFDTGLAGGEDVTLHIFVLNVPLRYFKELGEGRIGKLQDLYFDMMRNWTEYKRHHVVHRIEIAAKLEDRPLWRQEGAAFLEGKGISNQGRVRSDNPAPLEFAGLYFRSQPEINLCKALANLSIPFAPLAVFLRGDGTFQRIENDFTLLYKGRLCVVEVDGAQHTESPVDAQKRLEFLAKNKAEVYRVAASDCATEEQAVRCAQKILNYFDERLR